MRMSSHIDHSRMYWWSHSIRRCIFSSVSVTEPSFFEITSRTGPNGQPEGVTRLWGHEFITTGVLGVSAGADGAPAAVAFPGWATIPTHYSLADSRLWHFFFAWLLVLNGVVYIGHALVSRHLRRDLLPTQTDWRGIGASVRDHLRFPPVLHGSGRPASGLDLADAI